MNAHQGNEDSTIIKQALKEIYSLKNKLKAFQSSASEPIAIIGVSCRLPDDINSPDTFWDRLINGQSAIKAIPANRWNHQNYHDSDVNAVGKYYNDKGGFINEVDMFDAAFFNISPLEAIMMDPQQRLSLETSWHALENAGIPPDQLKKTLTGVFVGMGQNDYAHLTSQELGDNKINAYFGSGNGHCFTSGRISHVLGLNGPSLVVDTACSSSLLAIHLACQSLRNKECNVALAGGVQLMLSPLINIYLSRAQALSPTNSSNPFSDDADGFVRGEGVAFVVLKRLNDALVDKDRVLAVIKGSAVNHDGSSNGLTVPNGLAQQDLIRSALQNANVKGLDVNYVEAHGTGTVLGDPIELEALNAVYGHLRDKNDPLYVGSVKSNIGHLEAVSGIAGLLKTILVLKNEQIVPNLNFNSPNCHFDWQSSSLKIPTENISLSKDKPLVAGINSFGLSGTNVHIILEQAPLQIKNIKNDKDATPFIILLSAKTKGMLLEQVHLLYAQLSNELETDMHDLSFSTMTLRQHFNERIGWVVHDKKHFLSILADFKNEDQITQSHDFYAQYPLNSRINDLLDNHNLIYCQERDTVEKRELFEHMIAHYVTCKEINLKSFCNGVIYNKIDLPLTCFQKQRYWIDMLSDAEKKRQRTMPVVQTGTLPISDCFTQKNKKFIQKEAVQDSNIEAHSLMSEQAYIDLIIEFISSQIASTLEYPKNQYPETTKVFYEMGIDSLSAIRLKENINANFRTEILITDIFEHHTIDRLSRYIFSCINNDEQQIIDKPSFDHVIDQVYQSKNETDLLLSDLETQIQLLEEYGV